MPRPRIPRFALGLLVAAVAGVGFSDITDESSHALGGASIPSVVGPPAGSPGAAGVGLGAGYEAHLEHDSAASRLAAMKDIRRAGLAWVRIDVPFRDGRLLWETEPIIRAAREAGLSVDGLITDWSSERVPAADRIAAFGAEAAAHLGPLGVRTWEVLNEPNLASGYGGPADPGAYAHLLAGTYRAIKQVDPGATVLFGGLGSPQAAAGSATSADPVSYLRAVMQAGAALDFDGVAVHPYTFPAFPDIADPRTAVGQLVTIHQMLGAAGRPNVKVWITEYGAPTGGPGSVTLSEQAAMIDSLLVQTRTAPWIGPVMIFDWRDNNVDGPYGLLYDDGSAKPAVAAVEQSLASYENALRSESAGTPP